jgi:hypothetical protein
MYYRALLTHNVVVLHVGYYTVKRHGCQTWVYEGVFPLCIFLYMGVFYHCPTSFTTMLIKCYADQEIFFLKIFSIPTTTVQPRLSVCTVLHAIYPYNCGPPSHLVLDACYTLINP